MLQNISEEFKTYTRRLLGEERYELFVRSLEDKPCVSIRLNPFKEHSAGLSVDGRLVGKDGLVPWESGEGVYLSERFPFTSDPLFHAGVYYVQEASSMFVGHIIRQFVNTPATVLDLCAAPGGKSTLLRSVLPEGSLLVANEVVTSRTRVLQENLIKWGHPDVVVTHNKAEELGVLTDFFDVILADVPCSGEGMFRKEAAAVSNWSPNSVQACSAGQRRIIKAVWPALKPGGLLIYSTCTLNRFENEENISWIERELDAEVVDIPNIDDRWGILRNLNDGGENTDGHSFDVCRFIPPFTRGEGFFVCVLRKTGEWHGKQTRGKVFSLKDRKLESVPNECRSWVKDSDNFSFYYGNGCVQAFKKEFTERVNRLRMHADVWNAGVAISQKKGTKWIPTHDLVLSAIYKQDSFPCVDFTYNDALRFLRGETLVLDSRIPKGRVVVCYDKVALGVIKNIGTRANNGYPWRILSSHLSNFCIKGLFS